MWATVYAVKLNYTDKLSNYLQAANLPNASSRLRNCRPNGRRSASLCWVGTGRRREEAACVCSASVCIGATGMEAQAWSWCCQQSWLAHYPDIIKGLKWEHLGSRCICFSINCLALISAHCGLTFSLRHTSYCWTWQEMKGWKSNLRDL